jgi:hypothetical protein
MLRRALKAIFHWAIALLILFEEWGWVPLASALARLGRLPVLRWVERCIRALPPYAALLVFFLPSLALLPVKLFALWLVGHGQPFLGVMVILVAKIVGTAVVARLFMLTQPALMQLPWFASLYVRWTTWKDALIARVRASAAWRAIAHAKARARTAWTRMRAAIAGIRDHELKNRS